MSGCQRGVFIIPQVEKLRQALVAKEDELRDCKAELLAKNDEVHDCQQASWTKSNEIDLLRQAGRGVCVPPYGTVWGTVWGTAWCWLGLRQEMARMKRIQIAMGNEWMLPPID